jgi:hypothetical protein
LTLEDLLHDISKARLQLRADEGGDASPEAGRGYVTSRMKHWLAWKLSQWLASLHPALVITPAAPLAERGVQ